MSINPKYIQVNLPTIITCFRILIIPFMLAIYYMSPAYSNLIIASLFTIAAITDWLDGYLARRLGQTSKFGAFLDPVADKLLVMVALLLIIDIPHLPHVLLPCAVIIGREITVSALRELMSSLGDRASVMVNQLGRIKTFLQMLALVILLLSTPASPIWLMVTGYAALYLATLMTIASMIVYLKISIDSINNQSIA